MAVVRGPAGTRAVAERRWAGVTEPTAAPPSRPGAAMRRIVTIYGCTAEAFLDKLTGAGAGPLLDGATLRRLCQAADVWPCLGKCE